jgi:hypothetical protein
LSENWFATPADLAKHNEYHTREAVEKKTVHAILNQVGWKLFESMSNEQYAIFTQHLQAAEAMVKKQRQVMCGCTCIDPGQLPYASSCTFHQESQVENEDDIDEEAEHDDDAE